MSGQHQAQKARDMDETWPLAAALVSAFGMYLLVGAADNPFLWSDQVIRLATAGGFGSLVWYLIVRHLPELEARYDKRLSDSQMYLRERDERLDASLEQLHADLESLRAEVRALRDATRPS